MSRGWTGWQAQGFVFDGAIAAYLLAPTDGSYELDKLGAQYFQKTLPPAKEYLGGEGLEGRGRGPGGRAESWPAMPPCCLLPCMHCFRLAAFGLTKVYEDIELPVSGADAEMEQAGMLVDEQALAVGRAHRRHCRPPGRVGPSRRNLSELPPQHRPRSL